MEIDVGSKILTAFAESFYATKEERRKTAKKEYENQMAQRAHLQGAYGIHVYPIEQLLTLHSFH